MKPYRLNRAETGWMLVKPCLSLLLVVALCSHSVLWLVVTIPVHFITVVSTLHDVVHRNVRLSRALRDPALFFYGALMLQSGHSFLRTHLFHHSHFPSAEDIEGHPAFEGVFRALLTGPTYLGKLWLWTWARHPRDRSWLALEAANQFLWLGLAMLSGLNTAPSLSSPWSSLNALGPGVIPFAFVVASWGLPLATTRLQHNGRGTTPIEQTRTIHQPQVAWLLQGLSYHREHHMNPSIPALKLRNFVKSKRASSQ